MGKKVRVVTKCGGEFFYDHNQEVESVEIIEKEYDLQDRFDSALEILNPRCDGMRFKNNCAFSLNASGCEREDGSTDCAKLKAREALQKAVGFRV